MSAGRIELLTELGAADAELKQWLPERTRRFLAHRDAEVAIAGALPDARLDATLIRRVWQRFTNIAKFDPSF